MKCLRSKKRLNGADSTTPVAYYSRRLSPSEEKYSTYQHELLAIRDCLLAFRFYLGGLPFVCKTDHCSLQWLTEQAEMSPLQSR